MDWHASLLVKHVGQRTLFLLVLVVGPAIGLSIYRNPLELEKSEHVTAASVSTAEVLRNMQTLWGLTQRQISGTRTKFVKQDSGSETEGAANALAYLTDSFGGQLAGQILSVILSSVTGDVRGILGNSLNLFQTDESRDRVQAFLDEISQNFLKLTGLGALTTTKPPAQQSTQASLILGTGNGQYQQIQQASAFPLRPSVLQSGSTIIRPGIPELPSSSGLQQQNTQDAGQQQIIYVLPNLSSAAVSTAVASESSSGSSGTTASKTPAASKVTSTGDDDSEEDRQLWGKNIPTD